MTTNSNNSLKFTIRISKEEVKDILVRYIQGENLINGEEEKYLTEMNVKGKNFLLEFIVPLKLVEINKEKYDEIKTADSV